MIFGAESPERDCKVIDLLLLEHQFSMTIVVRQAMQLGDRKCSSWAVAYLQMLEDVC